jgi:polyisoprenoid-binding protein YceI
MPGRKHWSLCALALLCLWPLLPATATAGTFDPAHSRFGFELRTRWGMKLEGQFPRYEGEVKTLAGGQHQVVLRMFTQSVEIIDHPRYTEWTRSEKFFEADRYPVVVFVSRPYAPELLRTGGPLAGELSIRGISRPKTLTVAASTCARPALDCDVVATGAVRRSDYDMDDWMMAVSDRVVFVLRARLKAEASP